MFKSVLFFGLLCLCSCTTSKSIQHFAHTNDLTIKTAGNINFFNGSIQIQESPDPADKKKVWLLYKGDSLQYVSNGKRIPNNDYIYKIQKVEDTLFMLTRASLFVRYYTADTLLFRANFVINKGSLYDNDKVVQSYIRIYNFSGDTLTESSYRSPHDLIQALKYKPEMAVKDEFIKSRSAVQYYPNEERRRFFKKFIEY